METSVTVSTFYSFTNIPEPAALRAPILAHMQAQEIRGTITLAREGINATISGASSAIEGLMEFLKSHIRFTTPTYRENYTAAQPFKCSKVKVKPELISLGVPADPSVCVGTYVLPRDWNALIASPDVVIIDTRKDCEFQLGHFAGALNPGTRHFKQMVGWTESNLAPPLRGSQKSLAAFGGGNSFALSPPAEAPSRGECKKIAMYCTGGIRCDKYSAYLMSLGFREVYHLHGGILAYLEHIPQAESLWHGECFVFDERVSVVHTNE